MKLYVVIALISVIGCVSAQCNIPPQFWCDSLSVAQKCGVESACREFLNTEAAEPVKIELYFESLCPGCRQFITTQLYPTWMSLKESGIMTASMVPYGNAKEVQLSSGMWNYTCQHGAEECVGNLIENCIIHYSEDKFDTYFPILYCMEDASDPIKAAEMCVKKSDLDWDQIHTCSKGEQGNHLMHKSAMKTEALDPAHKYVPWIVANGKHTEGMQQEAQGNLMKFVCDTYTGTKPKECQSGLKFKQILSFLEM
ncbi:gamma-interferon-inducible lysosomal thiol reductase-like [Ciona intestinalis]